MVRGAHQLTLAEMDAAHEAWGANCGPTAVAAILEMGLEALRPHLGDFEKKGYTNPTLMWEILKRLEVTWRLVKPPRTWPAYGLARIQWEGPWTAPGVPIRARYCHTHWVAARPGPAGGIQIFDCNTRAYGCQWCSLDHWVHVIRPWITSHVPRANGRWHLTHVVEIR